MFWKVVPTQDVTNPVSLPSFYCLEDILLVHDSLKHFFISHIIGPSDLPHPSAAPHLKTSQVYLIYFPKCPSFSTIQSSTPNIALP